MEKQTTEERIRDLEIRLGIQFIDRKSALHALTHKSYINEHRHLGLSDNERLEFLGDAVLDLVVSQILMTRFQSANEGELSKLRALIVNEDGLSKVAREIHLGDLLLLGRGEEMSGGRDKASVLADALEAVLGAYFLGSGFPAVLGLVERLFSRALGELAVGSNGNDYKTLLQEGAQHLLKAAPRYRVVSEKGPDHEKTFEVEVAIGSEPYARATGRSKKEAEQAAARQALERFSDLEKKNQ